jgi:two-component system OmpR family sensor kinase
MQPLSLRARLTLVYVLGVSIALVAVFAVLGQVLRARLMGALDQDLAHSAAAVRVLVLDTGLDNGALLSQRLNTLSPAEQASAPFLVIVRRADGMAVASVPDGLAGLLEPQPAGARTVRLPAGFPVRVDTEPLPGGGVVQAAETLDRVNEPLAELRLVMATVGGVTLPLVAVLAYVLAGRGLRPLEEVVAFARALRAGEMRQRLGRRRRPPEVQRLADAFDAMLERLEAAFAQQQRFATDVSHELRTPLTALRGGIDVLLMQPDLAPDTREQLNELSAECLRLIRLTQNLLALTHVDAGGKPATEPVDLDRICLEAVRQARGLRAEVKVDVGQFLPVMVRGDADLLRQLLLNLVENAVRYTPEGGHVTVALARDGPWAVISVADSGPGIRDADLPHIFERFYRGAAARQVPGGMGLGLALVRWIATAHGGEVTATNRPAAGAVLTVRLPVADDRTGTARDRDEQVAGACPDA